MLSLPDAFAEGGRKKGVYYRFNEVRSHGWKVTCFAGGDSLLHRRNQISSSLILNLRAKCRRIWRIRGGWFSSFESTSKGSWENNVNSIRCTIYNVHKWFDKLGNVENTWKRWYRYYMDGMIIWRIVKFSFIRNLRQMDDLDEQELFRYFRAMEYVHVEFFVPRVKWAQSLEWF